MRHFSLKGIRPLSLIIVLILFPNSALVVGLYGNTTDDIQTYLINQPTFDESDFSKLNNGEMVAKLLSAEDEREVGVLGIIPIRTELDQGLQIFQEILARQNKKSIMEFGSFSDKPVIEDLKSLTLEKIDIEDLKRCRVGNCALKLSEAMIRRFQKEVAWNAPDYELQATLLFRKLILEYLEEFLQQGNPALIEYSDKAKRVNLQKEQNSLLKKLTWVNRFAPEFAKYLEDFPHSEPKNVSKTVNWTKIKFGLKPVILITQTINYRLEKPGTADPAQIISVSRQLYASHYFDSSLGLTALINLDREESPLNAYLIYINHSRSTSLDGAFSKYKKEIVQREAMEKLSSLLPDTKYLAESSAAGRPETTDLSLRQKLTGWLTDHNKFIWMLVISGFFLGLSCFLLRITKRNLH